MGARSGGASLERIYTSRSRKQLKHGVVLIHDDDENNMLQNEEQDNLLLEEGGSMT